MVEPFDFGVDEDGEPFRTFIVSAELFSGEGQRSRKKTDRQELALRALAESAKKFSNAWRRRTRPRSSLRSSATAKCASHQALGRARRYFCPVGCSKAGTANTDPRLYVARKTTAPDDWDPPYES
jgi:hypothetical protein